MNSDTAKVISELTRERDDARAERDALATELARVEASNAKIARVKAVRMEYGLGLKEAKDAVENESAGVAQARVSLAGRVYQLERVGHEIMRAGLRLDAPVDNGRGVEFECVAVPTALWRLLGTFLSNATAHPDAERLLERSAVVEDLRASARRERACGFEGNIITARVLETYADRYERGAHRENK